MFLSTGILTDQQPCINSFQQFWLIFSFFLQIQALDPSQQRLPAAIVRPERKLAGREETGESRFGGGGVRQQPSRRPLIATNFFFFHFKHFDPLRTKYFKFFSIPPSPFPHNTKPLKRNLCLVLEGVSSVTCCYASDVN